MKIKHTDYWGFDHAVVAKQFDDNPQFINYMPLKDKAGNDFVGAVYFVAKPNRKLGHKTYLILLQQGRQVFITGMTKPEMKKLAVVNGILCKCCQSVLYSIHRHHFNECECPNRAFADGGRDYLRYGAYELKDTLQVTINLLTNEVKW